MQLNLHITQQKHKEIFSILKELTQLLIDDALRTESTSNWLDSLNGLEQESELDSGDDWLETIDELFAVEEE